MKDNGGGVEWEKLDLSSNYISGHILVQTACLLIKADDHDYSEVDVFVYSWMSKTACNTMELEW